MRAGSIAAQASGPARRANDAGLGDDRVEPSIEPIARHMGHALRLEGEAEGEGGRGRRQRAVVMPAALAEPEAGVVEGEEGDEEDGGGDDDAAERFGHAERAGRQRVPGRQVRKARALCFAATGRARVRPPSASRARRGIGSTSEPMPT